MLLTENVKLKWNSKNYKHYTDLGYLYTGIGTEFTVSVNDLTNGSHAIVTCICDYCGEMYEIKWYSYVKNKQKSIISKDCCCNPDCTTQKAKESLLKKYGTCNIREIPGVNEKIIMTNLERYGCENPFGNKDVQDKIKHYYIDNFNVTHNMQIHDCVEKVKETCLLKYGVENYTQTKEWRDAFSGSNNPKWKGEFATTVRDGRELPEYRDWRKFVFNRDFYTCQCCGNRNGNGKYVALEAHHIFNWKDNQSLRYDVSNGITLCKTCHLNFHSVYGKRNNTDKQLFEFIDNYKIDKKIC